MEPRLGLKVLCDYGSIWDDNLLLSLEWTCMEHRALPGFGVTESESLGAWLLQMPETQTRGDHVLREWGTPEAPATPKGVEEKTTPKISLERRLRVHQVDVSEAASTEA